MLSANVPDSETIKTKEKNKQRFHFDISSKDGRKITYHFQPYKKYHDKTNSRATFLEKIESTHTPNEWYKYSNQSENTQKKLKERRGDSHRVHISYYTNGDIAYKGENSHVTVSKEHIAFERVKEVNVAVNNLDNLELMCRFTYTENKNTKEAFTDAYDDQNRLTRYIYSTDDFRLRTINHFEGSNVHHIFRTDKMFWGKPGSPNDSNLITRSVGEGWGKIHFAENYQYDLRGNPIARNFTFLEQPLWQRPLLPFKMKKSMVGNLNSSKPNTTI